MNREASRSPAAGRYRAALNVASNWASIVLSATVSFFLSPFVVHSLGNDAYGIWVLLGSLVGYLGLLDLGVRSAVMKYVATYHAASRHDDAESVLSTALGLFATAGLAAIALSVAFAWLGMGFFEIPPDLAPIAGTVLVICGTSVGVSLVTGVFAGVVVGRQRFDLLNAISVISVLPRALAVVLALASGGGLLALAAIQLVFSAISCVATAWMARRIYPELRIRLGGWSRSSLRSLLSFGLFASLISISTRISNYSDSVVIGVALPVGEITFFAIATSLVEISRNLVRGISSTMVPMAGALEGGGRSDAVHNVILTGANFASLVSLPIVVTFILRGSTFIELWMGPDYAGPAGAVLVILACGHWVATGMTVASGVLTGLNKHRGLMPAIVAEAVGNVTLSIALVGPLGITGVALGTLVPRLAVVFLFGPWYLRRSTSLPIAPYAAAAWLRPLAAMIPFAIASYAIEVYVPATNLAIYFAQVGLALPVAAIGAWFVGLEGSRRRALSEDVRRWLESRADRSGG